VPCRVEGIPAVYNVNGKQFVVIGARRGPGGFMAPPLPSDPPRMYIAFALSETTKAVPSAKKVSSRLTSVQPEPPQPRHSNRNDLSGGPVNAAVRPASEE